MSSVYTSTKFRRRPSEERALAESDSTLPSVPAMPFGAARWPGQKQDGQDYKWSGDKCQKKSAEKAHSAVDAAKSCKSTEY